MIGRITQLTENKVDATNVQIEPGIHAHRCATCAKSGITTLWIHGDENAGKDKPHECPRCGSHEWQRWLVPVGELPKMKQAGTQAHFIQVVSLQQLFDTLYMGLLFVFALCLVMYTAYILWTRYKKGV